MIVDRYYENSSESEDEKRSKDRKRCVEYRYDSVSKKDQYENKYIYIDSN